VSARSPRARARRARLALAPPPYVDVTVEEARAGAAGAALEASVDGARRQSLFVVLGAVDDALHAVAAHVAPGRRAPLVEREDARAPKGAIGALPQAFARRAAALALVAVAEHLGHVGAAARAHHARPEGVHDGRRAGPDAKGGARDARLRAVSPARVGDAARNLVILGEAVGAHRLSRNARELRVLVRDLAPPDGRLREVLDAARRAVDLALAQHKGCGALAARVVDPVRAARALAAVQLGRRALTAARAARAAPEAVALALGDEAAYGHAVHLARVAPKVRHALHAREL